MFLGGGRAETQIERAPHREEGVRNTGEKAAMKKEKAMKKS